MGMKNRLRAMSVSNGRQLPGNLLQRFLPRDGLEGAAALGAGAAEGMEQPLALIPPGPVIGDRTLAAERPAVDRMRWVPHHLGDRAIALDHHDPTTVVAIPRASRFDQFLLRCHLVCPAASVAPS